MFSKEALLQQLQAAIHANEYDRVDALFLPQGMDINGNNSSQTTLHKEIINKIFFDAIASKDVNTIKHLIKYQPDPNTLNSGNQSALHLICWGDTSQEKNDKVVEILDLILPLGLDLTIRDGGQLTALHYAVATNQVSIIEKLGEYALLTGRDIGFKRKIGNIQANFPGLNNPQKIENVSPIELAQMLGFDKIVKAVEFVEKTRSDAENQSVLQQAQQAQQAQPSSAINQVPSNQENKSTREALMGLVNAVKKGDLGQVNILLSSPDININEPFSSVDGQTILHVACCAEFYNKDIFKALLDKGADLLIPDNAGSIPLDSAAATNCQEAITEAFMYGISNRNTNLIRQAVKHKPNVKTLNAHGQSVLHMLCWGDSSQERSNKVAEILDLILPLDLDFNAVDGNQLTAIHYAAATNQVVFLEKFRDYATKADLDIGFNRKRGNIQANFPGLNNAQRIENVSPMDLAKMLGFQNSFRVMEDFENKRLAAELEKRRLQEELEKKQYLEEVEKKKAAQQEGIKAYSLEITKKMPQDNIEGLYPYKINCMHNVDRSYHYNGIYYLYRTPIFHPYNPTGSAENNELPGTGGFIAPLAAIRLPGISALFLPKSIQDTLATENISQDKLDVFFVAQNMPWVNETLLFRPHYWLHGKKEDDAEVLKHGSLSHPCHYGVFSATNGSLSIEGQKDVLIRNNGIVSHGGADHMGHVPMMISSPANGGLQGLNLNTTECFYTISISPTDGRAAVTLHWLLDPVDHHALSLVTIFTNNLMDFVNGASKITGTRLTQENGPLEHLARLINLEPRFEHDQGLSLFPSLTPQFALAQQKEKVLRISTKMLIAMSELREAADPLNKLIQSQIKKGNHVKTLGEISKRLEQLMKDLESLTGNVLYRNDIKIDLDKEIASMNEYYGKLNAEVMTLIPSSARPSL